MGSPAFKKGKGIVRFIRKTNLDRNFRNGGQQNDSIAQALSTTYHDVLESAAQVVLAVRGDLNDGGHARDAIEVGSIDVLPGVDSCDVRAAAEGRVHGLGALVREPLKGAVQQDEVEVGAVHDLTRDELGHARAGVLHVATQDTINTTLSSAYHPANVANCTYVRWR